MPGSIQSVERAAAILRLFGSGSTARLGVAEMSNALGLPKTTVHGLLRTLQRVGFVEQDPASGEYQLGTALRQLGGDARTARGLDPNALRAAALPWADVLAVRSAESVRIGMAHGGWVSVVHHVFRPDNSRQILQVGDRLPLHATALGKVLVAYDPLAARTWGRARPTRFTSSTITDHRAMGAELVRLRRRGWGAEVGELVEGQAAVAAPIRARGGALAGAIGISGPVVRICVDGVPRPELVSHVREAARAVSLAVRAVSRPR